MHRVDDRYFFEVPDSLVGRDFLMVTRVAGVPAGAGGFQSAGSSLNERLIRWDRVNDRVLLKSVSTGAVADEVILAAVKKTFLFNPAEIIRQLDLRRPIYRASTHYGHFGKKGLPWETTSKLPAFVQAIKANVR